MSHVSINKNTAIKAITVLAFFTYFYPITLSAFPISTGRLLQLIGVLYFAFYAVSYGILKSTFKYFCAGLFIFIMGCASAIVINGTNDLSMAFIGVLMFIYFCSAFVLSYLVFKAYRKPSIDVVLKLVVIVTILQSIISLLFFAIPTLLENYYSYVIIDDELKSRQESYSAFRLIGIGSMQYATSAVQYGIVLWALIYLKARRAIRSNFIFFSGVILLGIAGALSGRTFFILLLFCIPFTFFVCRERRRAFKILLEIFLPLSIVAFVAFSFFYAIYPEAVEWVFEIFINMATNDSLEVESASTNQLLEMYIWPTDLKTWIIGDGQAVNPSGFGFYKNTDVGYIRSLYYWGVIGSIVYYYVQVAQYYIIKNLYPSYSFRVYSLFILFFLFIFHFKDFWQLYLFYALFIAFATYSYYHEKQDKRNMDLVQKKTKK